MDKYSDIFISHRTEKDAVRGQNAVNNFDTLSKKEQRSTTENNRTKI